MAYATNRFPAGSGPTFTIAFDNGYIDKAHVKAFKEDATTRARTEIIITPAMWVDAYTLNLGITTAAGFNTLILRDTPKGAPLVDFQNRSRITEANLDKLAAQAINIGAETSDATSVAEVQNIYNAAGAATAAKDQAVASAAGAAGSATTATTKASEASASASAAAASVASIDPALALKANTNGSNVPAGNWLINAATATLATDIPAQKVADYVHAAGANSTPVDADETLLVDSGAAFAIKRLTWANIKATLKAYFDPLYAASAFVMQEVIRNLGPNAVYNGSFEDGTNGWTLTPYTGGSIATDAANNMDGATALAITSTVLANGGGSALSNEYRSCTGGENISFLLAYKASVINISSRARVLWYDAAKALISSNDIYTTAATPTAQTLAQSLFTAPATARWYRLELTGGIPASGTAVGTIYFDGIKGSYAPAAGSTCTYTGSLVESAALNIGGPDNVSVAGTIDVGGARVLVGIRITASVGAISGCAPVPGTPAYMYLRGINLKNN